MNFDFFPLLFIRYLRTTERFIAAWRSLESLKQSWKINTAFFLLHFSQAPCWEYWTGEPLLRNFHIHLFLIETHHTKAREQNDERMRKKFNNFIFSGGLMNLTKRERVLVYLLRFLRRWKLSFNVPFSLRLLFKAMAHSQTDNLWWKQQVFANAGINSRVVALGHQRFDLFMYTRMAFSRLSSSSLLAAFCICRSTQT